MNKFLAFLERNVLNIFIVFLLVLNILPVLAPIFAHFGWTTLSSIIYEAYSYICHERAWRSLHIFDYQFAWCVRDTFIYLSLLLSLVVTKYANVKGIKWYVMILMAIPIALDGGIQTIAEILTAGQNIVQFYESNNFFRMFTGTLFGLGIGFWMWPSLKQSFSYGIKNVSTKKYKETNDKVMEKNSNSLNSSENTFVKDKKSFKERFIGLFEKSMLLTITILTVFNMLLYVFVLQVWNITSTKYKPTNIIDSDPKSKATQEERCLRAEHSTNPKKIILPGCE